MRYTLVHRATELSLALMQAIHIVPGVQAYLLQKDQPIGGQGSSGAVREKDRWMKGLFLERLICLSIFVAETVFKVCSDFGLKGRSNVALNYLYLSQVLSYLIVWAKGLAEMQALDFM